MSTYILKHRFHFYLDKVRLADQEMIAIDWKDSLLFTVPKKGTCHTMQGHMGKQSQEAEGKRKNYVQEPLLWFPSEGQMIQGKQADAWLVEIISVGSVA